MTQEKSKTNGFYAEWEKKMASPYSLLVQAISEGRARGDDDNKIADDFFAMLDSADKQIVPKNPDENMTGRGAVLCYRGGSMYPTPEDHDTAAAIYKNMLSAVPTFSK